jgi:hypothetical protein
MNPFERAKIQFETTKQTVLSSNIVGLTIEEATQLLPNIYIVDVNTNCSEVMCCSRCRVSLDKQNKISNIVGFG